MIDLPPGSYVASATLWFSNDSTTEGLAYCGLTLGGNTAQAAEWVSPHRGVNLALTIAQDVPGFGASRVRLSCVNNTLSGGNLKIETFSMYAMRVGSIIQN